MDVLATVKLPRKVVTHALGDVGEIRRQVQAALDGGRQLLEALSPITSRAQNIAGVIDRLGPTLDEVAELVGLVRELVPIARSIQESAALIAESSRGIDTSSAGIDTSAALIARDAEILVGYLPMLERLTDIANPLEGTVQRLGRVVDRLPGGATASRAATGRRSPKATDD